MGYVPPVPPPPTDRFARARSLDDKLREMGELQARGFSIVALARDLGLRHSQVHLVVGAMRTVSWDPARLTAEQRRRVLQWTGWREHAGDYEDVPREFVGDRQEVREVATGRTAGPGGGEERGAGTRQAAPADRIARTVKLLDEVRGGYFPPSPKNLARIDAALGLPRAKFIWRVKRAARYYGGKVLLLMSGYGSACWVIPTKPPRPPATDALEDHRSKLACRYCGDTAVLHVPDLCEKRAEYVAPALPPASTPAPDFRQAAKVARVELDLSRFGREGPRYVHVINAEGVGDVRPVQTRTAFKDEEGRYAEEVSVDEKPLADFYDTHILRVEEYSVDGSVLLRSTVPTRSLLGDIPGEHKTAVVRALLPTAEVKWPAESFEVYEKHLRDARAERDSLRAQLQDLKRKVGTIVEVGRDAEHVGPREQRVVTYYKKVETRYDHSGL